MQLDHIAIIISREENLEFYKKFGFEEKKRFTRTYDMVIFMENNGVVLEIFIDPKHPKRLSMPEARGLRHIAFSVDDFDKTVAELDCEMINIDFFGRRFTFVKDPDGQPIEIKEKL